MPNEKQKLIPIEYEPFPDDRIYDEVYANNVFFEPSVWDLKLIFGQLDQRQGKNVIRQHTAVTLPWQQVKILANWLSGYIEFHETLNGKIIIPTLGLPPEMPPPSEEQKAADPNTEKVYEIFNRYRNQLLGTQKD